MTHWLSGSLRRLPWALMAVMAAVSVAAPVMLLAAPAAGSGVPGAQAAAAPAVPLAAQPRFRQAPVVVFAGVPGLRWSDVSPRATPQLWRLAERGSAGALVVRTVLPRTCPVDGWLTLNSGARAMARHTEKGRCPPIPPAAALPGIARYNQRFHYNPHWGLLASAAGPGQCVNAAGPGAALALAAPSGPSRRNITSRYLATAAGLSRAVLARCPLTVADLGALPAGHGRAGAVRAADRAAGAIAAAMPPGGILVVAAPADGTSPHLRVVVVSGAGYRAGLVATASTRQPGLAQLTDLTAAVLAWRHQPRPADLAGSPLTREPRADLPAAVRALVGQDTAAQVYRATFGWFFAAYAAGAGVLFGVIALASLGMSGRRRRAAWIRAAGAFAGAVVAGSFLASLVPWWLLPHPAALLYLLTAAWAAVVGAAALAGPWRRHRFGPAGVVGLITVAVIGVDVMTGSRLQLGTPFGLSTLEAGRFYGIGNNALGPYAAAGILAAAWVAELSGRRGLAARAARAAGAGARLGARVREDPAGGPPRWQASGSAALAVAGVAVFTVTASGWPGFGSKFGGTVAMVPAFLLLALRAAGVRVSLRRAALVAVSGVAAVAAVALVNYFVPVTGHSHIGDFVGQVLHGGAGAILARKISSNVGSLTITPYSPLVPVLVIMLGLLLVRPRWLGARWLPETWAAEPLLRPAMAAVWVAAVLGWFADDSGVTVAAAALPFALPLAIALHAGAPAGPAAAAARPVPPAGGGGETAAPSQHSKAVAYHHRAAAGEG